MVVKIWGSLPDRFPIILDIFQIMPNHFHGIIFIVGAGLVPALSQDGHPQGVPLHTLGDIVGAFKSLSTNAWGNGKFWQRNYFEHIIRDEKELFKIREYIKLNPQIWDRDRNNPEINTI